MKAFFIISFTLTAAAAAFAADYVAEGPGDPGAIMPSRADGTLELKWDNGTRRWSWAWYTGAGSWAGNDFDLSTLSTYRAIRKIRFYTRGNWPNNRWDGFRVAFFSFGGGIPGSRLWPTASPGYYFRPSAPTGHIWIDINIGWTCPTNAFVAAEEQLYNYPNCDPYAVDNNPVFLRHSWHYSGGNWEPVNFPAQYGPYYNVMLRVVVDDEAVTVTPTSLGRVRALYL